MSGREFFGLVLLGLAGFSLRFAYQSIRRSETKYAALYGVIAVFVALLGVWNLTT